MDFRVAWVNLNRNCNMHCRFCYAGNRLSDTDVMDIKKIEQMIEILKEHEIKKVLILGGEPTLYSDLEKVIMLLEKNNIKIGLQTNGLLLNNDKWKKLLAHIDCSVSIKAFSEKTYIRITGRKDFWRYESILRQIIETYPSAGYTYVLDSFDEETLNEIVEGIKSWRIKRILISSEQIDLEGKNRDGIDLWKIRDAYQKLFDKLKRDSVQIIFDMNIPLCMFENDTIFEFLDRRAISIKNCQLINPCGLVIDTDYSILPCNMFTTLNKNRTNLFDSRNSLSKIYEEYKNKYFAMLPNSCKKCDLWNYCMSGCGLRWKTMDYSKYLRIINFDLKRV